MANMTLKGIYTFSHIKSPCKDCKNRSATCHGTCKLYERYKKELTKANFKQYSKRHIDNLTNPSNGFNWRGK